MEKDLIIFQIHIHRQVHHTVMHLFLFLFRSVELLYQYPIPLYWFLRANEPYSKNTYQFITVNITQALYQPVKHFLILIHADSSCLIFYMDIVPYFCFLFNAYMKACYLACFRSFGFCTPCCTGSIIFTSGISRLISSIAFCTNGLSR